MPGIGDQRERVGRKAEEPAATSAEIKRGRDGEGGAEIGGCMRVAVAVMMPVIVSLIVIVIVIVRVLMIVRSSVGYGAEAGRYTITTPQRKAPANSRGFFPVRRLPG